MIPAKLEEFPSYQNLTRLQDLEGVERLQSAESLARLETSSLSYEQVDIPPNSVIYADIPYEGTACDIYAGFDHKRFLDWAAQYPNIFISSYEIADPRFICVLEIPKAQLSNGKGYGAIKMERIYTTALSAYLPRP